LKAKAKAFEGRGGSISKNSGREGFTAKTSWAKQPKRCQTEPPEQKRKEPWAFIARGREVSITEPGRDAVWRGKGGHAVCQGASAD